MNSPLVSIGVPSYNRPKTLERTLTSLVNQTYPNLEIVISDDCSTNPEVEKVIQKFQGDPRVIYYHHAVNKGAIGNFNFILGKLSGEYFMRIADDDWLDLNYVEACLTFLLANPDYSSAYGLARVYDTDGSFVRHDSAVRMDHADGGDRIKHYYENVKFNSCYYGLMHRSYLPLAYAKNIIAMDWIFVARVAFLGKYRLIETTHTNISMGGDSKSFDHLTQAYGMSPFTKAYPLINIGLNVGKDIISGSPVYRKINVMKRLALARECVGILYSKFPIMSEFIISIIKLLKKKKGLKASESN